MLSPFFTLLLPLLQTLTISLSLASSNSIINISHLIFPKSNSLVLDPPPPHPNPFLKDVLEAIAEKEKWKNLDGVRLKKLDVKKIKHGTVRRYDFRVRVSTSEFVFKLFDQLSPWNRLENLKTGSDFEDLVKDMGSDVKLDVVKLEGPFELSVRGDDHLSLKLPLNKSLVGLKRILVGEDVTVEIIGAKELNMFHKSDLGQEVNGKIWISGEVRKFGSLGHLSCPALLPIHILGSSSVVAYRTWNPDALIETTYHSRNTIELLPGKCYARHIQNKRSSPMALLSTRITLLEKVLNGFASGRNVPSTSLGSLNAKVKASCIFRFQLELERDIQSNDTHWSTLAEWRTRPTVERLHFEVVARFDGETLKPLLIKKVRPIIEVDSLSWSNLLSNISFTKSPSVLVPPESLTLDVKW